MNRSTTTLTLLKESLRLLMLIMNPMLVITTSVLLILVTMDTLAVLTVRNHMRGVTTALVLSIIIPRLSLLLITQDIMRAMEVITRIMIFQFLKKRHIIMLNSGDQSLL